MYDITSMISKDYLESTGLGPLEEAELEEFYSLIHNELEQRTGSRLSRELSNEQTDEFAELMDGDDETARHWLDRRLTDWRADERFARWCLTYPGDDVRDYAMSVWLETEVPHYGQIVERTVAELVAEVRARLEGRE